VFADVAAAVESKRAKAGLRGATTALCLTHRFTRIPGWKESLALLPNTRLFALEPGAGAKGAAKLANLFEDPSAGKSVVLLASRPWHGVSRGVEASHESPQRPDRPPTHVLHRAVAYPISASPLAVSSEKGSLRLALLKEDEHPAAGHCTIRREGEQVVLTNLSPSGTLLDGVRITGSAPLRLGQRIRAGESEETLQLIACLNKDEA
jgi:hypothetical protein